MYSGSARQLPRNPFLLILNLSHDSLRRLLNLCPGNIGLIGGGNISETHARAALAIPDVAIAAIYGTNMRTSNVSLANTAARPSSITKRSSRIAQWIS